MLGDVRDGPGFGQGPGPLGVEPGETGLLAATARAATRIVGASAADGEAGVQHRGLQQEAEARLANGGNAEGFDPREGLRRIRTTFPMAVPADEPLAEGPAARSMRGGPGASPGAWEPGAGLGGAAIGGTIERLLREQNELIKQDIQRNANPPIAAPPPMRGGGLRM